MKTNEINFWSCKNVDIVALNIFEIYKQNKNQTKLNK